MHLGGIALDQKEGGSGFPDWVLRQRHILIKDASISWQDDKAKTPRLELKNVSLHLENSGHHHRFGLVATPPAQLASPVDLRGDLIGKSIADISTWKGELFLQLFYVDIVAWRTWVPLPIDMSHGSGGLRMWLGFDGKKIESAIADVRLANVNTKLASDLPELKLKSLSGRLGWKNLDHGFEISTAKLGLSSTTGT